MNAGAWRRGSLTRNPRDATRDPTRRGVAQKYTNLHISHAHDTYYIYNAREARKWGLSEEPLPLPSALVERATQGCENLGL
jgi:hypothetical protein